MTIRAALAILRESFGIMAEELHDYRGDAKSVVYWYPCYVRYSFLWRWEIMRRETCKPFLRSHDSKWTRDHTGRARDRLLCTACHEEIVSVLRAVWVAVLTLGLLAGAWRAWYWGFVAPHELPGAHGEPLPRDWRAPRGQ